MSHKIARFSLSFVSCLFVSFCLLTLSAPRGSAQDQGAKMETAHHALSVTGCLQKGQEAGGFTIIGEDGKMWELFSRRVKLDEHVGHKVTLTGYRAHESEAIEAKKSTDEKAEAGGKEYADMNVTSLKMVSDTCSQ